MDDHANDILAYQLSLLKDCIAEDGFRAQDIHSRTKAELEMLEYYRGEPDQRKLAEVQDYMKEIQEEYLGHDLEIENYDTVEMFDFDNSPDDPPAV